MTILAAINGENVPSQTLVEGQELAAKLDEELIALHVMPQETFDEFRSDSNTKRSIPFAPGVSYGELDKPTRQLDRDNYTIEDGERDSAELVEDVARATLDDLDAVEFEGRVGDIEREVLEEAKRRDVRYIVIGGRKRSSVGKAVFGSATQSILLDADRPVLVVMRQE